MDVTELKIGSVIKISPRPNEEGVLFITDIQHSSVIGEMISPRLGYHFRIKHNEILPLELDAAWLEKIGLTRTDSGLWTDVEQQITFQLSEESGFLKDGVLSDKVKFVHELQNKYQDLSGQQLLVTPYIAE